MYYKKDGEIMRNNFGFGGVRENFGFGFDGFPWLLPGVGLFVVILLVWFFLTYKSRY